MEKSLPVSLGLHRWCDCDFSLATGLLPKEIKLNFIEKKVPTKRKGRILCYNKSWETLPQEQMFLVIPPPTWKATGIRAKEEQCCLACCRKPHFIGMQELQQNKEEEKKMGKWPQQLLLMEMAWWPLILLFMVLSQWSPENISEAANEKTSFEKVCVQVFSSLMPQWEGMFPLCVGFWYVALKRILNPSMKRLNIALFAE